MAKVLFGKEGFLFLAGDNNSVIDQHTGKKKISKKQLTQWKAVTVNRAKFLQERSCSFIMQIVPDKHTVYPEYLPITPVAKKKKNVTLVKATLEPILNKSLAMAEDLLMPSRLDSQLYHKIDTHWTDKGAFIAYSQFVRTLSNVYGVEVKAILNPEYEIKWFGGDLGSMLDLKMSSEAEIFIEASPAKEVFNNRIAVTGKIQVYDNPEVGNDLTLLIFGGSSSVNFLKFATGTFRKTVFCWSMNFDFDLIKQLNPDIVLNQIRERFLVRPANDILGINPTEAAFIKGFKSGYDRKLWLGDYSLKTLLLNCMCKIGHAENYAYSEPFKLLIESIGLVPLLDYSLSLKVNESNFDDVKRDILSRFNNLINEIASSELFCEKYVKKKLLALKRQPAVFDDVIVLNYLFYGRLFGYRSSRNFCGKKYWDAHNDVKDSGMHPVWHYERHGRLENRQLPI